MTNKSRLIVLAACAFAFGLMAASAFAADAAPARTITVTGQGDARAVPDEAQLSTGVVAQGRTAAEALAANSEAMNAVFDTLKQLGIPERSIQTSEFNVSPQYRNDKNGERTNEIIGYEVTNSVSVTLDDLKRLGPVLDALVASGSNSLGNIAFTIHDPKPLMTNAREAAMKDAMDRATTYARAGGLTLGRILSVSEGEIEAPHTVMRMAMDKAPARASPRAGARETAAFARSQRWSAIKSSATLAATSSALAAISIQVSAWCLSIVRPHIRCRPGRSGGSTGCRASRGWRSRPRGRSRTDGPASAASDPAA